MRIYNKRIMNHEEEIRTLSIPSATIYWNGPISFSNVERKSGGGLYVIIKKDGRPIYVGQTGSFSRRFRARNNILRQTACDLSRRVVYLGVIQLPRGRGKNLNLRLDLESVLIRSYLRRGFKLANRSSIKRFMMGSKDALIQNKGIIPPKMKRQIILNRKEKFELDLINNGR